MLPADILDPLVKVIVPLLPDILLPSATAPDTARYGLPLEANVKVPVPAVPDLPNVKLPHAALVILTVTV